MLANHTSIAVLFKRIQNQFDKLYDKRVFLDAYRRQPMFADNFHEFDDAYDVVSGLVAEYQAAERDDFITWGGGIADSNADLATNGDPREKPRGAQDGY